jgi:hypothetical protein
MAYKRRLRCLYTFQVNREIAPNSSDRFFHSFAPRKEGLLREKSTMNNMTEHLVRAVLRNEPNQPEENYQSQARWGLERGWEGKG